MRPFDSNGAFQAAADAGDKLRLVAVRGAGVTVFSSILGLAVQIIATVVLARILTPGDFGVVAMVTTFSLLLMNFGLNGFTEAVLQREVIDHALASNLFWINLGIGSFLTIGFAAAGSLLAWFYGDPRVARVAAGMSLTIIVTSASVQHLALLKRAMRFSVVSATDLAARATSVAVSILLGWAGWGYWALVAGAVAQPMATCIGAWSACQWIPGLPRRANGTASMVRFALNIYGRFSVNYFARNMDNLLVGWRFEAQAFGFYKKAYDLFALSAGLLVSSTTSVAVSALSRLNRDSEHFKRHLLSALALVAFLGMGLSGELTIVGKDLIRLLLGAGWEPAGRIFTFFGPGIGVMLLYGTTGWIHLSIGRADRWFRWGVVEFLVTGLLFLLGLRWGPAGVAVAWTSSFWILLLPGLWYATRPIRLGLTPVIVAVWKYFLASLLAGCASAVILQELPSFVAAPTVVGAATRMGIASLLFVILYFCAVILLHQGCAPLYQIVRLLREMLPGQGLRSRLSRAVATSRAKASA
ncbi:MAG TPA: lipopolysaccharide biosynthesis protein [Candidatus Sulfotelmatobacter sp.]|nr:lipopolysaccharide biosynthesis protein [Candidatus Sulfotelmatobacter sp.]